MWFKNTETFFRDFKNTGISLLLLCFLVHGGGTCGPGNTGKVRPVGKGRLKFGQRFPNLDESSVGASGFPEGVVRRGTTKYKALKLEINTDVIFKDDGETNDNKRMTPRCAEKLRQLVRGVRNTWDGRVKVRVIRAYERKRKKKDRKKFPRKDRSPLHFEGRALDIQTSDMDPRKNPILGRLAINAGFDWVEYSSENYIHASVRATDNELSDTGCFSSNSSVSLQNGKTILMKDLKIGDQVASLDAQGKIIYSPVIMFFHRNPNLKCNYLIINTFNNNKSLIITPTHLIYKIDHHTQQASAIYAYQLAVGDHIYIRNTSSPHSVGKRRITSISASDLTGLYAPLTETGNILVDDIFVSCYAVFPSDTISHLTMLPVRIMARFFPNFFNTEEEVPWYPQMLFKFYSIARQWMEKL